MRFFFFFNWKKGCTKQIVCPNIIGSLRVSVLQNRNKTTSKMKAGGRQRLGPVLCMIVALGPFGLI